MPLILLKSSICLAVFMLFYKLCLENTSAHTFKRFYLIAVIIISIAIPFITFTEYIEVNVQPETLDALTPLNDSIQQNLERTKLIQNYLPYILWGIYSIGFVLFLFKFTKNLYQLINKIKQNTKCKHQSFINVLIEDLRIPHTFLNYIFLNKISYENKVIPQEILLHEQAHAKQKHSLDILFIEILQIIFWFNPLIYFIKKDIKLNHEFLADQQVLKQGIVSSVYQKTLLVFSSNAYNYTLAHAINYSTIKKRFIVMKTKTSKTSIWIRSLVILPLLAILIYSFYSQEIIEIEKSDLNVLTESKREKVTEIEKDSLKYNIITTPYGADFKLSLSDGTKVFLKSESELIYPVEFIKGQTRKVELVYGAAYFDVASNKEYDSNFIVIDTDSSFITIDEDQKMNIFKEKLIDKKP